MKAILTLTIAVLCASAVPAEMPQWVARSGIQLGVGSVEGSGVDWSAMDGSERFSTWRSVFGRDVYESEEHQAAAMRAFVENDRIIEAHNDDTSSGYKLGHNEFSDLTLEQFKSRNGFKSPGIARRLRKQTSSNTSASLSAHAPDSVDWVSKGAVTAVKNQGSCGSCWSFSTTGALEGAYFIATGELESLSEQQLVSCDTTDNGCSGGMMDNAFKWVKSSGGICTEASYTYSSSSGGTAASCISECSASVTVSGYTDVSAGDEDALKAAVAQQPVSVAIEADTSIQLYKSGVITSSSCGTTLDHGVLIVGYGVDTGTDYWKVKNSWGSSWGEDGYVRLERGVNMCGIAEVASYPSGVGAATLPSLTVEGRLTELEGFYDLLKATLAGMASKVSMSQ